MIPIAASLRKLALALALAGALLPANAPAASAPVAVFPLLNLSQGPNGIDLDFTSYLIGRLEEGGTAVASLGTVIAFMTHNRIRTAGELDAYQLRQVQEELGAAYVLLGSVVQSKEAPDLALGLTLSLVRTHDGRTIWTYSGARAGADIRRPLTIGEAASVAELQAVLADELLAGWPAEVVNREQQGATSIDAMLLAPRVVRPGAELHASVRFRTAWPEGRAPRIFFRADDQAHAGSLSPAGNSFEATWIAGEKDGRFPVSLLLVWPLYGRTETLPLGSYLVDGVAPLVALDLKGEALPGEVPVFRDRVTFVPSMIVRKPIARWRMLIKDGSDRVAVAQDGVGNIPARLVWGGATDFAGTFAEGEFKAFFEVWDEAGNTAMATRWFELHGTPPEVAVSGEKVGEEVVVGLEHAGKVPLAFWRLEMWSEEGRLIKAAEGQELPPQIPLELTAEEQQLKIEGVLETQDILGNKARREIKDLLKLKAEEPAGKEKAGKTATETWVNEF